MIGISAAHCLVANRIMLSVSYPLEELCQFFVLLCIVETSMLLYIVETGIGYRIATFDTSEYHNFRYTEISIHRSIINFDIQKYRNFRYIGMS